MKHFKESYNKIEIQSISLPQLIKLLKQQNIFAEHEFVRRISNNAKQEVQYFLNEYSMEMCQN